MTDNSNNNDYFLLITAVKAERLNMTASAFDLLLIGIQAVNDILFIVPQGRRQPAVAATNMDNQAILDAGLLQNIPGGLAMSFRQ